MSDLPLQGVSVIELGQFIAAPAGTLLLADQGADVIKIEAPSGDGARLSGGGPAGDAMFCTYNRNKRSVVLDLKSPEGREHGRALLGSADVVVQNLREGVAVSLGLGPDEIRELNPGVVYISITGYPAASRADGPRRGYDVAAQAETGMMLVNGTPDQPPLKVGYATVDVATSYLVAEAALAGLVGRSRTGEGTAVEISLYNVALHLQNQLWTEYMISGVEPLRAGNSLPHAAPGADLVRVRDGYVVVSAYVQAHWRTLCQILGRDDLVADPRFETNRLRVENRQAMLAELSRALENLTRDECVGLLSRAGISVGAVRSYPDARRSADFAGSGLLLEVGVPSGTGVYQTFGPPFAMGAIPTDPPPRLGADTDDVLAALKAREPVG